MILFICFSTLRKETIFKLELYHSEKYIYKFVLLIIKHLTKRKDKKKLTGLPPPAITAPALRLKIHIKIQHALVTPCYNQTIPRTKLPVQKCFFWSC